MTDMVFSLPLNLYGLAGIIRVKSSVTVSIKYFLITVSSGMSRANGLFAYHIPGLLGGVEVIVACVGAASRWLGVY